MAKRKMTNIDLQNTTQKTKDRATRTPLIMGLNTYAPEGLTVPVRLVSSVVLPKNATSIIWYINRFTHQYVLINTNDTNKTWTPDRTNGRRTNRTGLLHENHIVHLNTNTKTMRTSRTRTPQIYATNGEESCALEG
jgi:hypothetical protein